MRNKIGQCIHDPDSGRIDTLCTNENVGKIIFSQYIFIFCLIFLVMKRYLLINVK